jgi:hypothetical protein
MGPRDDTLNQKAAQLEKEFNKAVDELHRVGQEDDGEWTNDYENMVIQRNGMIALTKLAESAIHIGEEAIKANTSAINSNNSLFTRSVKRNAMNSRLRPEIVRIQADLRTFQMLTPAITNNWYKDPSGKHQERYRGESDWTDRVRDNNVETIDHF